MARPGLPRGPAHPLVRRGVGEQVPVLLDQAQHRLRLLSAHRVPAAGRASEQDHPLDPLRMARGVGDDMRARVVLPQQADLRQPRPVDDSLQVADHRLQRQIGNIPLRMPGPPPVVVHQREPLGQLLEDPAQERVLPFHPQIAERHPRNEDQRGAVAGNREGQAHTIGAASIADARDRLHKPTLSSQRDHDQDPLWRGCGSQVIPRLDAARPWLTGPVTGGSGAVSRVRDARIRSPGDLLMSQRRCGPRRWCRPGTRRGGIPPRAGRVAGRCQGRKAIRRTRLPERADFTTGSPYQSPARNPHPHPSPPHRGSDISHPRPAPAGIFARPRDARQTAIRQIRASADRRTMRVAAYRSAGSARHWVATLATRLPTISAGGSTCGPFQSLGHATSPSPISPRVRIVSGRAVPATVTAGSA